VSAADGRLFEVRAISIAGRPQRGGFAARAIPAGARICTLTGTPHSRAGILAAIARGEVRDGADPLELGPDRYLRLDDASLAFNHSCAPSAALAKRSDLIALRDLAPGEEITYDYATNSSTRNRFVMPFECACGAPGCRRRIGNLASVPVEQLRAYLAAGLLQDYLREEARALVVAADEPPAPANG
jgi:hypothetical protein